MQQSRNALAASYRKMPSAMQNKLKSNMGIKSADDFASHFHDKSDTQRGDMMRKVGKIESGDRAKILDHLSGKNASTEKKAVAYQDWGQYRKKDLVQQSAHNETLKMKVAKELRLAGDARGSSKFLEQVSKEKEHFKKVMRQQSLQERLRAESANTYSFGSNESMAKASQSATTANNHNDDAQKADNKKPPENNNQFFAA